MTDRFSCEVVDAADYDELLPGYAREAVAVEPAANMRAMLERTVPSVGVIAAMAESLPFEDRSVDAVVVGNAFHHFDRTAAFAEIRRVLRLGGVFALFWSWPLEEEEPTIRGIDEIFAEVERTRMPEINAAYRSWAEPPSVEAGFDPFERREFPHTHVLPAARLADLYATSSDVASLPADVRDELLERIRALGRGLPEILRLPSRTVVDVARRLMT